MIKSAKTHWPRRLMRLQTLGRYCACTSWCKTADNVAVQARFGVPYAVCGCLEASKILSAKAASNLLSVFRKAKGKEKAFNNPRPDLVSVEDANAAETHPSQHDSVAVINPGEQNARLAKSRQKELEQRARDLVKQSERGKSDYWEEIQSKRSIDHSLSFLCPAPFGTK